MAFMVGALNAAQQLMGHYRATTTDLYGRSSALYADKRIFVNALGDSGISGGDDELFAQMPYDRATYEAICKQETVNAKLQ